MKSEHEIAVILENPKYPQNVGGALRACAAFGASRLYWSGPRVVFNRKNLPRKEKGAHYRQSVQFEHDAEAAERLIGKGFTPVAVEFKAGAENLLYFEPDDRTVYLFGPEDGSLSREMLRQCRRFVFIPSHYCLNLAASVNVILFHHRMKRMLAGKEPILPLEDLVRRDLPELAISGRIRDGFEGR
jgi:tRNA(Leu) C34 or U34 (ribose-2'-O)-methylase TrmL